MTQEEVKEGNKLIAEFYGAYQDNYKRWYVKPHHTTHPYFMGESEKDFKYHSSWDWLMPVVEKIESLGYSVTIWNKGCYISERKKDEKTIIEWTLSDNKITAVYKAVVQFIKYYNSQNK